MRSFSNAIGIIGGAGPMASASLYSTILEFCQKAYRSSDYNEFPEIILISYPFTRGDADKIRSDLSSCFHKLKAAGASVFCIASHSFHGFLPHLPLSGFINLVEEGLNEANRQHLSKTLILADKQIQFGIFHDAGYRGLYGGLD